MAGRPRKPSSLKVLHGDFEKDPQRENKQEPKPDVGVPLAPKHLGQFARAEWARVTKELSSMGVLTKVDRQALEQYCVAYEKWRKALKHVAEYGQVVSIVDDKGNEILRRNPGDVACLEYSRLIHKYLTEFGLTPSSRSRLVVEKETSSRGDLEKKFLA